jgi:hypothetical protein
LKTSFVRIGSMIALAGSVGCATTGGARGHEPSPAQKAVFKALDDAQVAFRRKDAKGVTLALGRARAGAGENPYFLDAVAEAEAGWWIDSDALDRAAQVMSERLAAHRQGVFDQGLHDEMIFLCEAQRDQLCALFEAIQMMSAAEALEPPLPIRLRLGNLWQRAHTLRALAQSLAEPLRTRAILYAQQAREAFSSLARKTGESLPSIQILTEQFASLDGDCATALAAARLLEPSTLDPQDRYITYEALNTCGRKESATKLRDAILENDELGLFPAVYRYLVRH